MNIFFKSQDPLGFLKNGQNKCPLPNKSFLVLGKIKIFVSGRVPPAFLKKKTEKIGFFLIIMTKQKS